MATGQRFKPRELLKPDGSQPCKATQSLQLTSLNPNQTPGGRRQRERGRRGGGLGEGVSDHTCREVRLVIRKAAGAAVSQER